MSRRGSFLALRKSRAELEMILLYPSRHCASEGQAAIRRITEVPAKPYARVCALRRGRAEAPERASRHLGWSRGRFHREGHVVSECPFQDLEGGAAHRGMGGHIIWKWRRGP